MNIISTKWVVKIAKKKKFKSVVSEMTQKAGRMRGLMTISGNRVLRQAGLIKKKR